MHLLIVRLGSIGRRHLGILSALDPAPRLTIWRHRRPAEAAELPDGVDTVYDLDAALAAKPDAALLCGPASEHVEIARQLAERGIHLFIEKPISDRRDGVEALIELCARRRLVLMVGYCLRFHPAVAGLRAAVAAGAIGRVLHAQVDVGQLLGNWRPGRRVVDTVSAHAALGGGVLLELSHEIDYLCWALGRPRTVSASVARLGSETVDAEDCADLLLDFPGGTHAALHLDMLSRPPRRGCTMIGTEGSLRMDLRAGSLDRFDAASGAWQMIVPPDPDRIAATYRPEIAHFLGCVATGDRPLVTGEDGLEALDVVLAAKRAASSGQRVSL
jgi:predicted dehydrogenase